MDAEEPQEQFVRFLFSVLGSAKVALDVAPNIKIGNPFLSWIEAKRRIEALQKYCSGYNMRKREDRERRGEDKEIVRRGRERETQRERQTHTQTKR